VVLAPQFPLHNADRVGPVREYVMTWMTGQIASAVTTVENPELGSADLPVNNRSCWRVAVGR